MLTLAELLFAQNLSLKYAFRDPYTLKGLGPGSVPKIWKKLSVASSAISEGSRLKVSATTVIDDLYHVQEPII